MCGLVVTTEAHPALSFARTHSNNTLSFLGSHGPVALEEQSSIYYDSLHAAGLRLGTIQAGTLVQLARTSTKTSADHAPRVWSQWCFWY